MQADANAFKASWNWHELPIDDGDPLLGKVTTGETLIVEQHSGRKLRLSRFYQYPTYGGLLAGLPQARDSSVEEAARTAKQMFGGDGEALLVLRPRLKRLPPSRHYHPAFPPARLPLVASIALFDSTAAVDDQAFRSSAVVIWFQDHFGLPSEEHLLMQLRDLDWVAHAWDWDP